MAYGYACSSGRVGAYTCVPGPGVLNTSAALCTAYAANAPVLCLTSEVFSHEIGRGHGILHELPDQLAILRGLTKWSARISHPSEAPRLVARAFEELTSGRRRPVALECPWDTLGQKAQVELDVSARPMAPPLPDPEAIERAAKLIASAAAPLIMVGSGALGAGAEVLELARLLQAPVTAHRSGRGIVSEDSPFGLDLAAAYALWAKTDVLLAIGTRMELQFIRWKQVPSELRIVRVDIDPTEMPRRPTEVGVRVYEPRTYVASGYQDHLGFGYMTSLGVKVANPTRAVVSVNGDGGFMFGVQELATAVQHRIGSVAIVFNNRSFGNVLRDQKTTFGGRLLGEALRNPDFVKLAESFGAAGYRAATPGQMRSALERALADDAPALIEVPGEPGAEVSPWPFIHRG